MFKHVRELIIHPEALKSILRYTADEEFGPRARPCDANDTPPAGFSKPNWMLNFVQRGCVWLTYPTPSVADKHAHELGAIVTDYFPGRHLEEDDPKLGNIVYQIIRGGGFSMGDISCMESKGYFGTCNTRDAVVLRNSVWSEQVLIRFLRGQTMDMIQGHLQQLTIWIDTPVGPVVYKFKDFQPTGECVAQVTMDVPFPDWYLSEIEKTETASLRVMMINGKKTYLKDGQGGYYKCLNLDNPQVGTNVNVDTQHLTLAGRYVADHWVNSNNDAFLQTIVAVGWKPNGDGLMSSLWDLETGEVIDVIYKPDNGPMRSHSGINWTCEGDYFHRVKSSKEGG